MESVHGVDVSWLHHHSHKDHNPHGKKSAPSTPPNGEGNAHDIPRSKSPIVSTTPLQDGDSTTNKRASPTMPKQIPQRPSLSRKSSSEKQLNGAGNIPRRNSWLSSISSKFSSSPGSQQAANGAPSPPARETTAQDLYAQRPAGPISPKNAVLQPGVKEEGDMPYTPAPPKSTQPNFLQSALRRLSSSGGQLSTNGNRAAHGLCQRRVLNVDHNRDRCKIPELDQAKLRRVAFCVDVEIAGGPRYTDEQGDVDKRKEKKERKKLTEKGEGEALKHPDTVKDEKEQDGVVKATGEELPREPEKEGSAAANGASAPVPEATEDAHTSAADKDKDKDCTKKKKEKKKRSEEERKARKEKKRKLAEANGTLPVELVRNDSDSSLNSSSPPPPQLPATAATGAAAASEATPSSSKTPQISPTTDPVRIYRRCCQLRETPILKKITEQLGAPANAVAGQPGVVQKLDLTGYWLQLPDLVTLGDYLGVVPVKEVIMENCGLTSEGVRVLLSALLETKPPHVSSRRRRRDTGGSGGGGGPDGGGGRVDRRGGGAVDRVVLKNNPKIGREGWRYICTFLHMSRSIKYVDLSMIPFPPSQAQLAQTNVSSGESLQRTASAVSTAASSSSTSPSQQQQQQQQQHEMHSTLAKSIGERLAGPELELLNLAECGLDTEQLAAVMDGVSRSGLRRLGIAGNNITAEGMQHVARYLRLGRCEGLDLGGNDLRDSLDLVAEALDVADDDDDNDNNDGGNDSEQNHPLWALSLAACNLSPDSICKLFHVLVKLKNFRFIDLSHNHDLFTARPSALSLLRRYVPKMPILKRIHLNDTSMDSEQAIALAEVLPEAPCLAHVSLMENPKLAELAVARDEANQEEACAYYASLMAAVRVSRSIVCVDVDVPSADSSEIVKALAKQVVAYCLRNMEHGTVAEIDKAATAAADGSNGNDAAAAPESPGSEGPYVVAVPEVLLHLVGHVEGFPENHDADEPAPDQDYVIGSQGVIKALGICLNRGNDSRHPSADRVYPESGAGVGSGARGTASASGAASPMPGAKARDMSKNLLGSARKIRARLQPALIKEARAGDTHGYYRLLFLDQTLERMIQRFEDEYPDTRLPGSAATTNPSASATSALPPQPSSPLEAAAAGDEPSADADAQTEGTATTTTTAAAAAAASATANSNSNELVLSDDEDADPTASSSSGSRAFLSRPPATLSRANSDVSVASRALAQEEGRMHRWGQQFWGEMLKPDPPPAGVPPAHGGSNGSGSGSAAAATMAPTAATAGDSPDARRESPQDAGNAGEKQEDGEQEDHGRTDADKRPESSAAERERERRSGTESGPAHLNIMRAMLAELGGDEIKRKIAADPSGHSSSSSSSSNSNSNSNNNNNNNNGLHGQQADARSVVDAAVRGELTGEASALRRRLIDLDPEAWAKFVEAQEAALANVDRLRKEKGEGASGL